jgi:hypothetical protein
LILRLVLAFFAMMVAYLLSTRVFGDTDISITPEEASQAGLALLLVALVDALVLSYLILRSRWWRVKLIGAVILIHFGVETFMAQIETLYFNRAVQMEAAEFMGIVTAGGLRALVFAPLAVFIFGKLKPSPQLEDRMAVGIRSGLGKRFAILTVLYFLIYFLFGYFVGWQWEATRLYYSGTTAIKPFFEHYGNLFFREDPFIIPFQLLRGALWTALALLIARMMEAKRWQTSLAVAFTLAVLLGLPLGVFPNFYMPPPVAQSHFIEIASSILLFGGIAG